MTNRTCCACDRPAIVRVELDAPMPDPVLWLCAVCRPAAVALTQLLGVRVASVESTRLRLVNQ